MTRAPDVIGAARSVLDSPRFVHATTLAIVGTAFLADTLQRVIGWPGYIAVVSVLALLVIGTFILKRKEIGWLTALPVSLLIFVGWAGLSVLWSNYRWASVGSIAYLLAFTVLALYVAFFRDTIQIVRVFGDVLRLVLGLSLAVEIFSGVLIDMPLRFLAVDGNLAKLGPIQGLLATRNQLGLVAVIAVVTFALEYRTRSVDRTLALGSLILAGICVLLSRSPVTFGVVVALLVAGLALYLTRRLGGPHRGRWLWGTLVAAVALAIITWAFRAPLVAVLSANSELTYRLAVWQRLWNLIALNPLEGWGWIGQWRPEIQPFTAFAGPREPTSAVNGYLDVWFQLGLAGIFIFVVLAGLAFTRSWILAGKRRSVVFVWPALVLLVLLVSSLAESSILVDYGWLTFVVCCVKAARELSWRGAFATLGAEETDPG